MADSYRRNASDTYRPHRDGGGRDSYQPQRQHYDGQTYRPPPPRYDSPPPPPPRDFSFRGAAENYCRPDPPRTSYPGPPQSNFTFEASSGAHAPRFPQEQPQQRPNRLPRRNQQFDGRNGRGPQRGGFRGRRLPKPAHARDLLRSRDDRDTTPEQLAGMNADSQPRYAEYISSDDENDDESGGDDEQSHNSDGAARKRVKTDVEAESARPKWSNPDPYSVLPPTDLGIGPKKDIVQTIRKAKIEAAAQSSATNAVKDNVDFISFDDFEEHDDDEDDEDSVEMMEDGEVHRSTQRYPPQYDVIMPTDEELMRDYSRQFNNNDKKRKRDDELYGTVKGVAEEWRARSGLPSTPWFKPDTHFVSDQAFRLHKEIVDFYEYVRPHAFEEDIRLDLIDRVEQVVRCYGAPDASSVKLESFGSFASGLYLPVADMDLVARSAVFRNGGRKAFCQSKTQVHKLGAFLRNSRMVKPNSLAVIVGAKVPIIKFTDSKTNIKVDISFENDSGLIANWTVKDWTAEFPDLPVIVAIIKQMVAMRDLNEVATGGIGGFTIICLVVSVLQHISPDELEQLDPHTRYAKLLLRFLDFYGNKFDFRRQGIQMNPPQRFQKKGSYHGNAKINLDRLTVIDPNRPDNDMSGGTRHIGVIFECFRQAHHRITQNVDAMARGKKKHSSILECILGGNYSSFAQQRSILDQIDRARRSSVRESASDTSSPHEHGNASFSNANAAPPSQAQSRQSQYTSTEPSYAKPYTPSRYRDDPPEQNNPQMHPLPKRPPPWQNPAHGPPPPGQHVQHAAQSMYAQPPNSQHHTYLPNAQQQQYQRTQWDQTNPQLTTPNAYPQKPALGVSVSQRPKPKGKSWTKSGEARTEATEAT